MNAYLLETRKVSKSFLGVRALDDVSISLAAGEIHSLVGENGAGKSTLIKILSGVYPFGTFDGEIVIDGSSRSFRGVADAEAAGIAVIYQELSLVKELSVAENIFLGQEPSRFGVIRSRVLHKRTVALLEHVHLSIDPPTRVEQLGIGQQQLVEIAKALSKNARILILDEPTAALTETEAESLFSILARLKEKGVGIIYISHKLDEVLRISDRITVLRDGNVAERFDTGRVGKDRLIQAMVGREVADIFPEREHVIGEVLMQVSDLSVNAPEGLTKLIDGVSFELRKGEVFGIAGLMGSGRTELLTAIFGAWAGQVSGCITIDGQKTYIRTPADAIALGMAFVTEDRARYGLILEQPIVDNITLAALRSISGSVFANRQREVAAAAGPISSLRIKADSPAVVTATLSGGNQQKVVLGKWLLTRPRILLLDEPTRGIDVGAKQEIYLEIGKLAAEGMAILLVSSELPEVLGLSDRLLVLHDGRVTGEFTRENATAEKVMAAATGTL
jgi:D-xylose transport system ATP-binding protein